VEKTDEENFKNVERKNRIQIGFEIKKKPRFGQGLFFY
jgi:hypothetical protein